MGKVIRRKPATHRRRFAGLRFVLERLILRGLEFRLLLAVMIIVGVALFAGALAVVFDNSFGGMGEATWWAFLRLSDPGYLGDDEGIARRSISTLVTVAGYVLFLGLLVAILTQWMNETVTRIESGVTPVALSDHVVILGYTNQTRAIAESLMRARPGSGDARIVIMAEQVDEELRQRLRDWPDPEMVARRVLLRAGTPLRFDHLERVAFRDAGIVILPGAGFGERDPEHVDSLTIKTLAAVSRFARDAGMEPPFAVAELFDARRVNLANRVYDGDSEVVAADAIVSHLIAQSVRHRGLWSVMSELFMHEEGNAIHVRRVDGQAGNSFGDLRERFSRAILLGVVRPAERQPVLNPAPETVIAEDDLLVFLARNVRDLEPDLRGPSQWQGATADRVLRPPRDGTHRVLILGWSRKAPVLLRELGRFGKDAFEVDIVSAFPVETRAEELAQQKASDSLRTVRQIEAGYSVPGVLEGLELDAYHNIIVLASEVHAEKEHADGVSVVAALTMRGLFADGIRRPEVLVEILDQENQYLFRGGCEEVMISPLVVSYMVSRVALRRELAGVFWELVRPWGAQMILRKAEGYFEAGRSVRFGDVQQVAAANGEIALGFRQPAEDENALVLNPDRDTEWTVGPGDEVVVLISIREPEPEETT